MTDLTTAQKRKLIRELDKASKMHQKQADIVKKSLTKNRKAK